jgi:hypothetical protein
MAGILGFMEDNMKIISFIFITTVIFFSPEVLSDDELKHEYATNSNKSNSILERKNEIKILQDSVVITNSNPLLLNDIPGAPRVGNFIFEKTPNKLKDILKNKTQSTEASIYESGFRLVEIPGKSNLITDGSFVVFFKNSEDKQQFNLDYNLLPKYEMSNASTYKSDNFKTLQTLLDMLENDERVQLIELDLIDPYIVLQ